MYTYLPMYTYIYIYAYLSLSLYLYIYIYIYIHIYVYTYVGQFPNSSLWTKAVIVAPSLLGIADGIGNPRPQPKKLSELVSRMQFSDYACSSVDTRLFTYIPIYLYTCSSVIIPIYLYTYTIYIYLYTSYMQYSRISPFSKLVIRGSI